MRDRTITVIRHGATKFNGDGYASVDKIRGWSDVPLSAEGKADAKKVADELKNSGIKIIVSSDLQRAHDTAKEVARATGAKLIISKKLRPWDLGALTGQDTKASLPKIADYAKNKPDEAIPEGESFNSFKSRAFEGLSEVADGHPDDKGVAIVTHHRVERLIKSWQKAGQPATHDIDIKEFLQKGEPPGSAEGVTLDRDALAGNGKSFEDIPPAEREHAKAAFARIQKDLPGFTQHAYVRHYQGSK